MQSSHSGLTGYELAGRVEAPNCAVAWVRAAARYGGLLVRLVAVAGNSGAWDVYRPIRWTTAQVGRG